MTQLGVLIVGIRVLCGVWLLQWAAVLACSFIVPAYPTALTDLPPLELARTLVPVGLLALLVVVVMSFAPQIAGQLGSGPGVSLPTPSRRQIYGLAGLTVAAWALPHILPPLFQLRGLISGGAAGTTFGRSLAGDLTLHLLPALAGFIVFLLCARAFSENPQ